LIKTGQEDPAGLLCSRYFDPQKEKKDLLHHNVSKLPVSQQQRHSHHFCFVAKMAAATSQTAKSRGLAI